MKKLAVAAIFFIGCAFLSYSSWADEIDFSKLQMRNGLYYEINETKPFTGKAVGHYKNGQKLFEGNYINGEMNGLRVEYYMDGQKKEEGNFKDGKMSGLWVQWYKNGQKKSEGNYREGKQDGLWKWYYENGQKKYKGNFKDGRQID